MRSLFPCIGEGDFTFELNEAQKQAAAYLNDLGVDLIIGNHPHCLQTMQRLVNQEGKETMVFYSLGNLVSAAAMVDRASVDFANLYEMGAIVNLNVAKDGESGKIRIEQVHLTPYINHFDANYSHFQLIPFSEYTEKLAQEHCQRQYANNFTKEWLQEQLNFLFERKVQAGSIETIEKIYLFTSGRILLCRICPSFSYISDIIKNLLHYD